MNKEQKFMIIRIIVCALALAGSYFITAGTAVRFAVYLVLFLIVGAQVVLDVVKNMLSFKLTSLLDEKFLMTLACAGAFALSEYPEAVIIMLFYQIGEFFQDYAVDKSRRSIEKLMDIRPDSAHLLIAGEYKTVSPTDVHKGDTILIKPGEKIPLDGKVIRGATYIDTAALTGEALPKEAVVGDSVMSGCINISGAIELEVAGEFSESTVSRILALIEDNDAKKSKSESFIKKFARIYTPAVVACAVALAVLPPVITGSMDFAMWIHRALTFLVISCPCALVISVPLSFFGGIGAASGKGILIKGSGCIERLTQIRAVAFDKTGTLTKGVFSVTEAVCADAKYEKDFIEVAALAQCCSNHPVAKAITAHYESISGQECTSDAVTDYEEMPGYGVKADIMLRGAHLCVYAGNARLMERIGCKIEHGYDSTVTFIAINGEYAGHIAVSDELKKESEHAVSDLKKQGIKVIMLTGDTKNTAQRVADVLNIEARGELLPEDKVRHVKELMRYEKTLFAGDGINDTPVLAVADVGAAMGGLGSDAAIEAADIVIMDDDPRKISLAIRISKKTLRIAKENIAFSIAVKLLCMILGAIGVTGMYFAVFADVGVSVLAVLNALRTLRQPASKSK